MPRADTLADLAKALAVPVGDLITPGTTGLRVYASGPRLGSMVASRFWQWSSKWLDAYSGLEAEMDQRQPFGFSCSSSQRVDPKGMAGEARRAVGLVPGGTSARCPVDCSKRTG